MAQPSRIPLSMITLLSAPVFIIFRRNEVLTRNQLVSAIILDWRFCCLPRLFSGRWGEGSCNSVLNFTISVTPTTHYITLYAKGGIHSAMPIGTPTMHACILRSLPFNQQPRQSSFFLFPSAPFHHAPGRLSILLLPIPLNVKPVSPHASCIIIILAVPKPNFSIFATPPPRHQPPPQPSHAPTIPLDSLILPAPRRG